MNKIQIEYSTNFARGFKKLSLEKQKQALKAEKIFKEDQFFIKLKTHKLTGKLHEFRTSVIPSEVDRVSP